MNYLAGLSATNALTRYTATCIRIHFQEFPLHQLKYLNLTGVDIDGSYHLSKKVVGHVLPNLHTLILSDTPISLYDHRFIRIIERIDSLRVLDISLNRISFYRLRQLAEGLPNLETLNMAGE